MVNIIESLVAVVAIEVSFDKAKEMLTTARKLPMQAMQVQMEIFTSYAYLDSSSVDSFVPSYSSLDAYPVSTRTSVLDVYREVVYDLQEEEADIDPNVGTNVPIVHLNLPSVPDVGCS